MPSNVGIVIYLSMYVCMWGTDLAGEIGEGGGDGVGSFGESIHLEHTHRTVPDHSLRGEYDKKKNNNIGSGEILEKKIMLRWCV